MIESILLHTIPEKPGVYLMKDENGLVLYVGKAKNLRSRLTTYFSKGGDDRVQIPYLLQHVADVETILVSSETEALLLEARLIQQWKPKYNILLKDDKSHLRIRLDRKHPYPRLDMVRSKQGVRVPKDSFGPFVSSYYASQLFELLIRLFRLRQCTDEEFKRRTKPCLLFQLKMCSAPCVGLISQKEYGDSVAAAFQLLKGKKSEILRQLEIEMRKASDRLDFERAALLLEQKKVLESAFVQLGTSVSDAHSLDVIALHQEGPTACLCVMEYREGVLTNSRTLLFEAPVVDEPIDFKQIVLQYYRDFVSLENLPSQIIVSQELENEKALQEALHKECHAKIDFQVPERGRKKELVQLASENARVALVQKTSSEGDMEALLQEVQERLGLSKTPHVIDCFDVSHLSGKERVATCISFLNGKPNKRRYRTFKIQTVESADDCAMVQEAIERRYKLIDEMPDLILIDGGKLQLVSALRALENIGALTTAVRSISKEEGRHDRGMTEERVWRPLETEPLLFERTSKVLHFLQRVRDEAHRFSIAFQKKRRTTVLFTSQLDGIPGIGPKKKKALLTAFSGIEAIKRASEEELCQKAGLSNANVASLKLIL